MKHIILHDILQKVILLIQVHLIQLMKVVDNKITDTYYRKIKNNSLETYSVNSDLTTGGNLKIL